MFEVEVLKGAVALLMEGNQDRQDFTETEGTGALTLSGSLTQQGLFPSRFEDLAEVINVAEQFI